jgi:SAM-dependent methyltransferase
MPSIDENKRTWEKTYDWAQAGDEWSADWGSARAQWDGCLFPRVFPFLNGRILEIGTGFGRWTQFLQAHCTSLIGVDLSSSCIAHCTERFRDHANVRFEVNDGLKLPGVDDASIDFAFSFDSLVHAESDALSSYAAEIARVLRPGGSAFIHHSNLGGVRRSLWNKLKRRISGIPFEMHWRAASMSAEKMRVFAERNGMSCIQQEIIPWGNGWPELIDCISTILNRPGEQTVVMQNRRFMQEAASIRRISSITSGAGKSAH